MIHPALGQPSDSSSPPIGERIETLDWLRLAAELDDHGCAVAHSVLTPTECAALAGTYATDAPFRNRVVMARSGFGRGEYKYFGYPLPDVVASL